MSVLHSASIIYADFENVIMNTDYFVCRKLYDNLMNEKSGVDISKHPIHGFFDVVNSAGVDCIPIFTLKKKTHNPLRELADLSKIVPVNGVTKEQQADEICDDLYDSVLSFDYKDYSSDMVFTNTASAIKILLKDQQLQNVYIYVKKISSTIHKSIYDFFTNNGKIHIVTGDRRKFFSENKCDLYMFNNIMDIELLPSVTGIIKQDTPKIDVLFLDTVHNIDLWNSYFADAPSDHSTVSSMYYANISILKRSV